MLRASKTEAEMHKTIETNDQAEQVPVTLTRRELLTAVSACLAVACRSSQQSLASTPPAAENPATVTLAISGMT
jgi:hypothetical protein